MSSQEDQEEAKKVLKRLWEIQARYENQGETILQWTDEQILQYLFDLDELEKSQMDLDMTSESVKNAIQLIREAHEGGWACALEGPEEYLRQLVHDRVSPVRKGTIVVYNQLDAFEDIGHLPRHRVIGVVDLVYLPAFRVICKYPHEFLRAGGKDGWNPTIQQIESSQPDMRKPQNFPDRVVTLKHALTHIDCERSGSQHI
jgi:hypothetical protein